MKRANLINGLQIGLFCVNFFLIKTEHISSALYVQYQILNHIVDTVAKRESHIWLVSAAYHRLTNRFINRLGLHGHLQNLSLKATALSL